MWTNSLRKDGAKPQKEYSPGQRPGTTRECILRSERAKGTKIIKMPVSERKIIKRKYKPITMNFLPSHSSFNVPMSCSSITTILCWAIFLLEHGLEFIKKRSIERSIKFYDKVAYTKINNV